MGFESCKIVEYESLWVNILANRKVCALRRFVKIEWTKLLTYRNKKKSHEKLKDEEFVVAKLHEQKSVHLFKGLSIYPVLAKRLWDSLMQNKAWGWKVYECFEEEWIGLLNKLKTFAQSDALMTNRRSDWNEKKCLHNWMDWTRKCILIKSSENEMSSCRLKAIWNDVRDVNGDFFSLEKWQQI